MGGTDDSTARVQGAVAALGDGDWLLAVSGGVDSMVLLDAAAHTLWRDSIMVATFDHGTGRAATAAVRAVYDAACRYGVAFVAGHVSTRGRTEAEWRLARWAFLRDAAARSGTRIVTAHTRDDQIETVFMRAMRGAGARGLAGLYATTDIARPFLDIPRVDIVSYARSNEVPFRVDPSNVDRRHLRNRVRLDLLPVLERAHPGFSDDLLCIARQAADWRARIEALALTFPLMTDSTGLHSFERRPLRDLAESSLRVLWPALAARAGVILDWRGTERLAAFTREGATGQEIQVAGGVRVFMGRESITLHPAVARG